MAGNWLKLECKMLLLGWTSELPPAEYAAWIKILQVVKAFGERGGRIKSSYFDDALLAKLHLSRHALDQTFSKGREAGAITQDDEYMVINSWSKYQIDPDAAKRKAAQRAKDVTDVTVTPECHGCHDDRTGQDRTGQDRTLPPFVDIQETWNSMVQQAGIKGRVDAIESRKGSIRTRWRDSYWREHWREAIDLIPQRPFCMGENDRGWTATFSWFLKPDTVSKLIEGAEYTTGHRVKTVGKDDGGREIEAALAAQWQHTNISPELAEAMRRHHAEEDRRMEGDAT